MSSDDPADGAMMLCAPVSSDRRTAASCRALRRTEAAWYLRVTKNEKDEGGTDLESERGCWAHQGAEIAREPRLALGGCSLNQAPLGAHHAKVPRAPEEARGADEADVPARVLD